MTLFVAVVIAKRAYPRSKVLKGILGSMLDQKGMHNSQSHAESDQLFTLASVYRLLSSHCWKETNIARFALIYGQLGSPILAQW